MLRRYFPIYVTVDGLEGTRNSNQCRHAACLGGLRPAVLPQLAPSTASSASHRPI